ncbi:MAG: radical SAM protein [Candidatus Omnitrophota bacterium]|jgi:radical SAM superfamily enzyme YgiQ (UPF0313 family)
MNNDVILVFPGKYGSAFPGMPISLLYLGGVLERAGYKVRLVDTRTEKLEGLDLSRALCVGIGSMTGHQIYYGLEVARYARKAAPGMPIIWGGVHPTMLPEETLASVYADIVVRGEGEETLLELVRSLEEGRELKGIAGISYKDREGRIISNPLRKHIRMDDLPIELPYHLLKIEKYLWSFFIQTNRGCPYRCGYCCNLFYYRGSHRCKSPSRVLDEIEYLVSKFGLQEIGFDCDDAFFIDREYVRRICEGILERGIRISWNAPSRFDYFLDADEDFLRLLVKSGCRALTFGGDSGSERILSLIQKDLTVDTIRQSVKKIRKCAGPDIAIDINFILGFPTETEEDLKLTLGLMDELAGAYPNIRYGITVYTPYPKTPLYEKAKEFGFKPPVSLEEWGSYNFGSFRAPWLSGRYRGLIETLSAISRVDFCSTDYTVPLRFNRFPYDFLYRVLSFLGHARWKHKYFGFPLEWKLARRHIERQRGYF